MRLIGERIVIRPFRLDDSQDYLAYASDRDVTQAAGMRPVASLPQAQQAVQRLMTQGNDWAIEYQGRVIGNIGAYPRTGDPESPDAWTREIGYALAQPYWGQGLMTEALTLWCDHLFENEITAIWAAVFPDNQRSMRLLARQGFVYQFTVDLPSGLGGHSPKQEAYYRRLKDS